MKCINKKILALILSLVLSGFLLTVCIEEAKGTYEVYETSHQYGITKSPGGAESPLFSRDLIVTENTDLHADAIDASLYKAAGLFNITTKELRFAKAPFDLMYPASTTKVMTALCAFKYGDLEQTVTVSENALRIDADSSVAGLSVGDQLTVRQLLYALMLPSGNDAAIAIAEGVSGSVEAFVQLMNTEADLLGATNTHYVTTNGLPDDEHYTTVYDMYLIFGAACSYNEFVDIIKTASYDAYYTGANGESTQTTWNTTVRYLDGRESMPEGITVIGGKTGTTNEAGYCLVLLCRNAKNEDLIYVIFGADNRADLYYLSNLILYDFG